MSKVGIRFIVKGYFAIIDMSGYKNIAQGVQTDSGNNGFDGISRLVDDSCKCAFLQCMDPDPYPVTPLDSSKLNREWKVGFYVGADCPMEGKALRTLVYATSLIQNYALTNHSVSTSGFITKGEMDVVCSTVFNTVPSEVYVNDRVNSGGGVQAFNAKLVDSMVCNGILLVGAQGEKYVKYM